MKKLLLAILLSSVLNAQQLGTGTAVKSTIPTFDDDDRIMISALMGLGNTANKACNDLVEYKTFAEYQKNLTARMEAKYKGYTLSGTNLVEKK